MNLRIGTFNCENLFARFRFGSRIDPARALRDSFAINDLAFEFINEAEKKLTAGVIRAVDADVLALQEVENLDVLKRFRNSYLGKLGYEYAVLMDGNDPRFIDVAVLSRYPLVNIRTNQYLRQGRSYVFSRDCLEVDVIAGQKPLTLFVNHLKSMLDPRDPKNGRVNTMLRRQKQCRAVRNIVEQRFGPNPGRADFVILGDLNDYPGHGTGISGLVEWDQVENVVQRLPAEEQWTHFFEGAKPEEAYRQLDYLLLSRSLARRAEAVPVIERRGLCLNAARFARRRFTGVGRSRPAASDHCAVAMDIIV